MTDSFPATAAGLSVADYAQGIRTCTRLHNYPPVHVTDFLTCPEKIGNCPVCGGLELQTDV